jgi:1-acyl-sn-glycerol-3-phosphate acyltransferase
MIAARKNALFNFVLRRVLGWTLRRRFHNLYVAGGEHLRGLVPGGPVVGCVNHTNWWDGFVLYVLSHRLLPHEIYLAMEQKNLRQYPFFTWMGVFGLDLADPRGALSGLRYALRLLSERGAGRRPPLIWMFVPGHLHAAGQPIAVKPGALWLASRAGAQILPIVLRYEWLSESRPSIFANIGEVLPETGSTAELTGALGRLDAGVPRGAGAPEFQAFQPLFGQKMSINKWWDYVRHRLGRARTPFDRQNG